MIKSKKRSLIVASLLVLLLIIWGDELFQMIINNWDITAAVYGFLITAFGYYYSQNETFYLFVHKYVLFWFKNYHSKWKFFNRFDDIHLNRDLAKQSILNQFTSKNINVVKELENYLEIREDDEITYKFDLEEKIDGKLSINYRTSKFTVPWGKYQKELSKHVGILNDLAISLKPKESSYQIILFFEENNPYFGFFIRYLPMEMVNKFNCQFRASNSEESMINATKDRITIDSQNTESLRKSAMDYLTLNNTLVTKSK